MGNADANQDKPRADSRTREALRQSEAKYRTLFESIDQGFCIVELVYDPAGKAVDYTFVEVNAVFERQTGYADAKGQRASALAPNVPQAWIDLLDSIVRTGQPLRTEAFFEDPARWYRIALSRLGDALPAASPGRVAAVFDDITALKQAHTDCHQSEERAQFLLRLSDALRSLTDPVSVQQTAARLALEYFGTDRAYYCEIQAGQVTVQQHAARPDLPPVPPTYHLEQLPGMNAMLLQGDPVAITDTTTTTQLDPISQQLCTRLGIQAYIQVPLIKQGQLVAKFCLTQQQPRAWTSVDVQLAVETAERTWDVTQRARTETALRQSEAKYRHLFNSIDEGFCQIQLFYDEQGQPVDWLYLAANPTFERQVGVNPVGQRVSQVVGPVEAYWLDFYHQVAWSGQAARTENRVAALDRWYTIYAAPVEETTDQLTVVFNDCSAHKRLEAALRAADQRKDEFLAMLAHELRNPLATLRNGLGILSLGDGETAQPSLIAMMNRQMTHLVHMVDELLDVSRISRGTIVLKRERLDLGRLVAGAVEAIRPQYELRQKSLHLADCPTPLWVDGDATRLSQVVTNLLTNGLRYTGEGGQVWLHLQARPGEAILSVLDNGIGLSAEQLRVIFELFVQVDNSTARAQGGLGVGLTLAQRLVELHGGRIEATSGGLGQGSAFTVVLPRLSEPTPAPAPDARSAEAAARPRILVIDDNPDAALTLSLLLKLKGYAVQSYHSGPAGLLGAEAWQPEVIICDISMPGMDGYQTARLIREQPWGVSIRLIALTGYGQADDQRQAQAAGFDAHLVKPVELAELLAVLASTPPIQE